MWVVPWTHSLLSNTISFGLTVKGVDKHLSKWYDIMYYRKLEDVDSIN